jgi:hypothetical protein
VLGSILFSSVEFSWTHKSDFIFRNLQMSPLEQQVSMEASSLSSASPSPASTPVVSPLACRRRRAVRNNISKLQAKLSNTSNGDSDATNSSSASVNQSKPPTVIASAATNTKDASENKSMVAPKKSILESQGSTDANSSNDKKKRNARFGPTATSEPKIQLKAIPHYTELEAEVKQELWFTDQEVKQILKTASQTVAAMNDGVPLADDAEEFTPRGLEYMTPDGFDITTSSLDVVHLVLEEQTRQRQEEGFKGNLDDELVEATVGSVSRHRSRIAQLAAMKDARGVYGEGKFKLDPIAAANGRPSRSKSVDGKREPRRGRLSATGSMGVAAEKTRRRRGSRGPLQRRARHSAPDPGAASGATGLAVNVPEKARSSII